MSDTHPAKPLFDRLAAISEQQKPVPSWDQYSASSPEARRVIAAIWLAHSHRHVEAMLNLMKYEFINGPVGASDAGEFDYDGDGGREHDEYMRDNGMGRRAGSFQSLASAAEPVIAAALPSVEAPPLAPELAKSKVEDEPT